jgi:carbon starvation protein CstA
MGYLPGMLWILGGVVCAGAVQDFMVLILAIVGACTSTTPPLGARCSPSPAPN